MAGLGPTELLIIAGVILLLFGSTKLPQLMRGMGEGMKEFKNATKDVADEPPALAATSTVTVDRERELDREREMERERERLREKERELDRERERLTDVSNQNRV